MSDVYNSSTDGPIPLNFEGRRLMANLREAIQEAIRQQDFSCNDRALSRARAAIAKALGSKESAAAAACQFRVSELQRELANAVRQNAQIHDRHVEAIQANHSLKIALAALREETERDEDTAHRRIVELETQLCAAKINGAPPEPRRYAVFAICKPWADEISVAGDLSKAGARVAQSHPAHGATICTPDALRATLQHWLDGRVANTKANWDLIRKAALLS